MTFPLVTLKVPHDLVKVKGDAHALLFPAWDVEAYLERVHPPSTIVCMELLLTHTTHTHTTTSTRTTTYYQPPRTTKPPRTTTTTHSPTTKENNRNNHMLKAAVTCMPHDQLGCRLCCFHFGISASILLKAKQVSSASLMSFCKVSLLKSKGAKRVFFPRPS